MELEIGSVYNGKITSLTDFGAFVSLENGKKGMVHISEVSHEYIKSIKDALQIGQDVKVKLISVADNGKISLSIKQADENVKSNAKSNKPKQRSNYKVWNKREKNISDEPKSFEAMMAAFKQASDEKMSDLRRSKESKTGSGFQKRR